MSEWLFSLPVAVRLAASLILFVGITDLIVWRFHDRIVALGNDDPWPYVPEPEEDEAEDGKEGKRKKRRRAPAHKPEPPEAFYLGQRVSAWVGMAFVFLLAFTISNLWGNAQDAQTQTKNEAFSWGTAVAAARLIPADEGRDEIVAALDRYAQTISTQEWPQLTAGDRVGASQTQQQAAADLVLAIRQAEAAGAASSDAASETSSAVQSMLEAGSDRLDDVPSPQVPHMLGLLILLGIITLGLTAAFQTARLGPDLFLMGLMAAVVGLLLFFVTEISNPFAGASAITPMFG